MLVVFHTPPLVVPMNAASPCNTMRVIAPLAEASLKKVPITSVRSTRRVQQKKKKEKEKKKKTSGGTFFQMDLIVESGIFSELQFPQPEI
jgi:hypothetical protein